MSTCVMGRMPGFTSEMGLAPTWYPFGGFGSDLFGASSLVICDLTCRCGIVIKDSVASAMGGRGKGRIVAGRIMGKVMNRLIQPKHTSSVRSVEC